MKKELVLVKDLHDYWSCALCVTCTEGKQITNAQEAITLIKNEYNDLSDAEFVQEGNEIFALFENNISQINPGDRCK
jgi:hypothetical protein